MSMSGEEGIFGIGKVRTTFWGDAAKSLATKVSSRKAFSLYSEC